MTDTASREIGSTRSAAAAPLARPCLDRDAPPERQLAASLEAEIIFGHLTPGQRLVEDEILRQFDASRHHVRAALAILERTGIVTRERNKGARIRSFTAQEVWHLYDVREMLTRQAALRISLPVDIDVMVRLRTIQKAHDIGVDQSDVAAVHAANDAFHMAMFALCGNPVLVDHLRQSMDITYVIRAATISDPQRLEAARCEHHRILGLLRGTDAWALAEMSVEHLRPGRDAYLSRIEKELVTRRGRKPARSG